jgi:uracil-DNA glycosylase
MAPDDPFSRIYAAVHHGHTRCIDDEWLTEPCADPRGRPLSRPIVWSRRNGPWTAVEVLWVGAAPGNAGGMGKGALGAHGTRIPFGGDIAGANLDVMLGAIGRTRNDSFITASLNSLPARGGGEPAVAEMRAAVGAYPSSIHLLADTILAAATRLIIALGNVALRAVHGAFRTEGDRFTLPTLKRLMRAGLERNHAAPLDAAGALPEAFARRWNADTRARPLPTLLWLTHPSAQNMSPHARVDTAFHSRMVEAHFFR